MFFNAYETQVATQETSQDQITPLGVAVRFGVGYLLGRAAKKAVVSQLPTPWPGR